MNILSVVLTALGTIATNVVTILGGVFTGVSSIWITGNGSTESPYELTLIGAFSLVAFAFGLVYFAISFVGSLVRLRPAQN